MQLTAQQLRTALQQSLIDGIHLAFGSWNTMYEGTEVQFKWDKDGHTVPSIPSEHFSGTESTARFTAIVVTDEELKMIELLRAAKAAGADIVIMHPVVSDPTDFKGLPCVVGDEAEFLKNETLVLIDDEAHHAVVRVNTDQSTPQSNNN